MKSYKWKLANSLLVEIESAIECKNFTSGMAMLELISTDAKKLAEIIKEEEEIEEEREAS